MGYYNDSDDLSFGGCLGIIFIFFILLIPEALCWDYAVSHWLGHFGKPDTFKFSHALLVSIVPGVGQFGFAAAILTFIIGMFI
jgi:hypothetical protein